MAELNGKQEKPQCLVIGISGGSGSGKTFISKALLSRIGPENVSYFSHDYYYKDRSHLTPEEREKINFDHPDALDTDLLVKHLATLKSGKTVEIPEYDFTNHCRKKETKTVFPKSVVMVEGILLLTDEKLRDLLDIMVFIDTEPDIRFIRRLKRDTEERARTLDSVIQQYLTSVRPMHNTYVEPSKEFADIILPGGRNLDVAVDILTCKLQNQCL
eukprot:snap_masked-scaffold_9-processed-gene-10.27-mRNA-1 protein AED:0.28 eAED:0.28 QI:0/-1/0/1/-1/1/1/0/214